MDTYPTRDCKESIERAIKGLSRFARGVPVSDKPKFAKGGVVPNKPKHGDWTGDWTGYHGHGCPVVDDELVEVELFDGVKSKGIASSFVWWNLAYGSALDDIKYYRIILGDEVDMSVEEKVDLGLRPGEVLRMPNSLGEKNVGKKYDGGKVRFSLVPQKALTEVMEVLEFGAKKYGDENWKMVDNLQRRYFDASYRHIIRDFRGETIDDESGYSHLAHAICCLMFKLEDKLANKDEISDDSEDHF